MKAKPFRLNVGMFCMGVLILLVVCVDALAQQKLWVTSSNATLKASAKSSSNTISTLPVGAELAALETNGKWWRVETAAGESGWIYRGKVSASPPEKETEAGNSLFGGSLASSVRADASDTSRSIRGLSPEATEYANSSGTPQACRKALDKILAIAISRQEVDQFLATGKIGEYAE